MAMTTTAPPIVPMVVAQHAEEAALLWRRRDALARAPHVRLMHLARFDERLAAHLDGLSVAGDAGLPFTDASLETPGPGEIFTCAVRAIESRDSARLDRLFAVTAAVPEGWRGLVSAFGWVSPSRLGGIVRALLESTDPRRVTAGLTACSLHRVDPGSAFEALLSHADPLLRARAVRLAGELGRTPLLEVVQRGLADPDADVRFHAARSSLLLGERQSSVAYLSDLAKRPGPRRGQALELAVAVLDPAPARELLRSLAADPADIRLLVRGAGVSGDPMYLPWLLARMDDPLLARLAGEAFSLITGLDLAYLDLDRRPPESPVAGPSDDPVDPEVTIDDDEDLPWPDAARLQAWVAQHPLPHGTRHFLGEVASVDVARRGLADGFQRQRTLAALHLVLRAPGTVLFNTRAPAPRQKRLLATAATA